jgi:hypothetical protein
MHVVVRIEGQGYGHMPRSQIEALPEAARRRVEVLAVCPTKEKAKWIFRHIPQEWRDVTLAMRADGKGEAVEVVGVLKPLQR